MVDLNNSVHLRLHIHTATLVAAVVAAVGPEANTVLVDNTLVGTAVVRGTAVANPAGKAVHKTLDTGRHHDTAARNWVAVVVAFAACHHDTDHRTLVAVVVDVAFAACHQDGPIRDNHLCHPLTSFSLSWQIRL